MAVTAKLSSRSERDFAAAVKRIQFELGKDAKEVLKGHLRRLALELMQETLPFGAKMSAKRRGETNVESRIRSIYLPIGRMHSAIASRYNAGLAAKFVSLMRRRRFAEAEELLDKYPTLIGKRGGRIRCGPFDGGKLHRDRMKGVTKESMVVSNYPKVGAYVRKVKRRVGFGMASFVPAIRLFGTLRGVPAWVKRHSTKHGFARVNWSRDRFAAAFGSRLSYMREILPRASELSALKFRARMIGKDLKRIQRGGKYRRIVRKGR